MEFNNTTAAIGSYDVVDLQVPENPTSFQTCTVSGSELNLNDVFLLLTLAVSVGLIWDSESPDAEHIADVLQCIGTTLKLSDVRLS